MGVLFTWVSQNLGVLFGVLFGGGAVLTTVRYIREYERGVVTRFGKLVRITDPGPDYVGDGVREYSGFVFRVPGLWRVSVVNVRDRTDQISIDGAERFDSNGRREKWRNASTVKWHVTEGYVYSSTQWQIEDIGEFVRGMTQGAIHDVMVEEPADVVLRSKQLLELAEERGHDELLEHGITWTQLMIKEFARTDAEVQAQAAIEAAHIQAKAIADASLLLSGTVRE